MSSPCTLRVFALAALAGCGLDLGGEQFVSIARSPSGDGLNPSVDFTDAGSLSPTDGGVPPAEAAFGLDEGLQQGDASPGAVAPALDAEAAFVLDAGLIQQDARDGAPADADLQEAQGAATKDGADDGGTPCDTLMRCCPSLLGPALLICAAGAQQADGGDAGSCESLLAGFQGAGLCP